MSYWNELSEERVIGEFYRRIKYHKRYEGKPIHLIKVVRNVTYKGELWDYLKKKGIEMWWPLILPDLILVFEDPGKYIDNYLFTALEFKWFRDSVEKLSRMESRAYRELGQPLRYYLYGFDSVGLIHLFSVKVDENRILDYSKVINESIDKLGLPILYISIKILEDGYRMYYPTNIEKPFDLPSLIDHLLNFLKEIRNPIFSNKKYNKEILERRNAIKETLIP